MFWLGVAIGLGTLVIYRTMVSEGLAIRSAVWRAQGKELLEDPSELRPASLVGPAQNLEELRTGYMATKTHPRSWRTSPEDG